MQVRNRRTRKRAPRSSSETGCRIISKSCSRACRAEPQRDACTDADGPTWQQTKIASSAIEKVEVEVSSELCGDTRNDRKGAKRGRSPPARGKPSSPWSPAVMALYEMIQILRNESTSIAGLTITGLDDLWATNFNPWPSMAQIQPSGANLVLSHNPDVMDRAIWEGYQGWILAGHTHGGQCKPPFLPPPMLPVHNKRYTAGKFNFEDGRTLYINRALGNLWPVRFNVRPEVTVFWLEGA